MGYIDNQAEAAHAISKANGFWDEEPDIHFILSKIALLHSECSEILEATRKNMGEEAILEECADVYIRLVDLVEGLKDGEFVSKSASFGSVIEKKMSINAKRPRKHGNLA